MEIDWEQLQPALEWLNTTGLRILIILLGMLALSMIMGRIIRTVEKGFAKTISSVESNKRLTTLVGVLKLIVRITILIIGIIMILAELGLNMGPILATVGVFGLAVSFGAQSLVKDLISGIFLLVEDKIRVGDVVTINGLTGTVESIQLRVITLRAINGDLHVIPNGVIAEFTNMTKDYSRALWNVGVGYSEDIDRVMKVIEEEGIRLKEDEAYSSLITSDLVMMGLQEMGDSAIVVRCFMQTVPGEQWGITRAFNRRLKKRFDAEGIEIPFPHRTVYFGNQPENMTKPALGGTPEEEE